MQGAALERNRSTEARQRTRLRLAVHSTERDFRRVLSPRHRPVGPGPFPGPDAPRRWDHVKCRPVGLANPAGVVSLISLHDLGQGSELRNRDRETEGQVHGGRTQAVCRCGMRETASMTQGHACIGPGRSPCGMLSLGSGASSRRFRDGVSSAERRVSVEQRDRIPAARSIPTRRDVRGQTHTGGIGATGAGSRSTEVSTALR